MKIWLIVFVILSVSCHAQDCKKMPNIFSSYEQAISLVQDANFKISESVNTSKSSWVRSAHYYSCDGIKGYLIIGLKDNMYIHKDVPINIWNGFKSASSFGSYYDTYIKGRYKLYLN